MGQSCGCVSEQNINEGQISMGEEIKPFSRADSRNDISFNEATVNTNSVVTNQEPAEIPVMDQNQGEAAEEFSPVVTETSVKDNQEAESKSDDASD